MMLRRLVPHKKNKPAKDANPPMAAPLRGDQSASDHSTAVPPISDSNVIDTVTIVNHPEEGATTDYARQASQEFPTTSREFIEVEQTTEPTVANVDTVQSPTSPQSNSASIETQVTSEENELNLDSILLEEDNLKELLARLSYSPTPPSTEIDPSSQIDKSHTLECIYEWACKTEEFKKLLDWGTESSCRILWVNGDPGTGKSMLLTAAVKKLSQHKDNSRDVNVAYFIGNNGKENEVSVIQCFIYQILNNHPHLADHLRVKFKMTGRENFNGLGDFYAMSTVLYSLIQDKDFPRTYFVIDTFDQFASDRGCNSSSFLSDEGRPKRHLNRQAPNDLLRLIHTSTELSDRVKWLISVDQTECWANLVSTGESIQLHLNMSSDSLGVGKIVPSYAVSKVTDVADKAQYSHNLRIALAEKLEDISPSNFMWVDMALDYVTMKSFTTPWNAPKVLDDLKEKAPDVGSLYRFSMQAIDELDTTDRSYCRKVLLTAAVAYRPLLISELVDIIDLPPVVDPVIIVHKILSPFLRISKNMILFRHLSAKNFVRETMKPEVSEEHSNIVKRCIEVLLSRFKHTRPIYSKAPEVGSNLDYATIFWMKHLSEVVLYDKRQLALADPLLNGYLIQWLGVLDSRGLLQEALDMMATLDATLTAQVSSPSLINMYTLFAKSL